MNRITHLLIGLILLAIGCESQPASPIVSNHLVRDQIAGKEVTIYLPEGYPFDHPIKTVYFHDGQWPFQSDWQIQNVLDAMIRDGQLEPLILVGIHSTSTRTSDFVPYEDPWITQNFGNYSPQAVALADLVLNEIVSYIEANYEASPDPVDRALFGISFGGLHVLWEAIQRPQTWGMVGAISPSFWVNNYQVLDDAENSSLAPETKIWFDIGTAEWEYYVPLIDILVNKGYDYGKEAFYYEIPDARHSIPFWSSRIHMPLLIFAGTQIPQIVDWQIAIEFIPSQTSARIFKRINPIIQLSNGVHYSASTQATYELLNPHAGEVKEDGRFEFNGKEALTVEVNYQGLAQTITINPQ